MDGAKRPWHFISVKCTLDQIVFHFHAGIEHFCYTPPHPSPSGRGGGEEREGVVAATRHFVPLCPCRRQQHTQPCVAWPPFLALSSAFSASSVLRQSPRSCNTKFLVDEKSCSESGGLDLRPSSGDNFPFSNSTKTTLGVGCGPNISSQLDVQPSGLQTGKHLISRSSNGQHKANSYK